MDSGRRGDSAGTGALGKAPRKKGKKGPAKNIFLEFGMDQDARAMTEVEIGGIIVKRFNIKRFWQSDTDLNRWKGGLHSNSRFDKLVRDTRERINPEFHADQDDLRINHNCSRRRAQRASTPGERVPPAQELRELREKLAPKDAKKSKALKQDLSALFGSSSKRAAQQLADDPAAQETALNDNQESIDALHRLLEFLHTRYGSLETAFSSIDISGNGLISVHEFTIACNSMGYRNDVKCLMKVLDKSADGQISRSEFMKLKPYMNRSITPVSSRRGSQADAECGGVPVHIVKPDVASGGADGKMPSPQRQHSSSRQELSRLQAQATAVLLIFRNADHGHAGAPTLVRRWPPSNLADLVRVCAESCPPLIGPATKLVDLDLRAVRSVSEVQPGGAYLLRGQEALDPPPLFFEHRSTSEHSLRQLSRARSAAVVQRDEASPALPRECSMDSAPHGSPPWLSQSVMEAPRRGNRWQVDDSLGRLLTHGGLGQPHIHPHFQTWSRALPSSEKSIDRRSMSATL